MNIFISYSSKDFDEASKICEVVEENGFSCFIAPRNIRSGHIYAEEIIYGLKNTDVLLLVLTENSNASAHVMREVEWCVSNNVPILAYRLEEVELSPSMEYFLMSTQWLEGMKDKDRSELLDSLFNMKEETETATEQELPEEENEGEPPQDELPRNPGTNKKKKRAGRIWKWVAVCMIIIWFLTMIVVFGTITIKKVAKRLEAKGNTDNKTSEEMSDSKIFFSEEDTESGSEEMPTGKHKNDSFTLGSLVVLGTYGNEPIEWRVIHINQDGTVDMITDQIICCKAFDSAESGKAFFDEKGDPVSEKTDRHPFYVEAYGNNSWVSSNLRMWLNSAEKKVSYLGTKPTDSAMADSSNGYEGEAGFLFGFEEEERNSIVMTSRKMDFYDPELDITMNNEVYDQVRLLGVDEVDWLMRANVDTFVLPTAVAMKTDRSSYYRDYCWDLGIETLEWWLLSPTLTDSFRVGVVSTGAQGHEKIEERNPNSEGLGVRPVVTVNPVWVP